MEAFLDPPRNNVLMQTETVLVNKVNCGHGRKQKRIFTFEPAVLHEETKDKRNFLFASLFGNMAGRSKRFGANLAATAMERPVRVDAELFFLGVRKHDANMPIQKILERNQRRNRIYFAFRLDVKATDKIRKTGVDGSPANERAAKDVFTAHRKEERLEFAIFTYRDREAKFVKRKSPGPAIVNQVQAAALPHFHLGKQSRHTFLVGIKRQCFGLDESVV